MIDSKKVKALLISFSFALCGAAIAQQYPEKPIKLVVPYPPGGAADGVARQIAQHLSVKVGQTVVVENKAGAGGAIGADSVAKSQPDGYTLLLGSASELTIVPNVRKVPYNPRSDFAPVMLVAKFPMVLVANNKLPVTDLKSFIQYATKEAKANQMGYATIGVGTTTHIAAEYFRMAADIPPMMNIPYKGGAPALQDVMAGHAPFMFDTLVSSIGQIQSGTVKGLAITSSSRWEALPNIPTVAESGFPGFEFGGWSGVLAPKGTKPEIIEKLNKALTEVLSDQSVIDSVTRVGANATKGSPDDFQKFISQEFEKNSVIVEKANLKEN